MFLRTDSMGQLNLVKRDSNGNHYGSRSRLSSLSSNRSSVPREVTMVPTVPTTKMLNEKASILRKSPSIEYLNGDLTAAATNLNTKLTKDNLTRHVRILESTDKDESDGGGGRRKGSIDTVDSFSSRRVSIDSLDVRKNSIGSEKDIPEEDLSNLSLNGDNIDDSKVNLL